MWRFYEERPRKYFSFTRGIGTLGTQRLGRTWARMRVEGEVVLRLFRSNDKTNSGKRDKGTKAKGDNGKSTKDASKTSGSKACACRRLRRVTDTETDGSRHTTLTDFFHNRKVARKRIARTVAEFGTRHTTGRPSATGLRGRHSSTLGRIRRVGGRGFLSNGNIGARSLSCIVFGMSGLMGSGAAFRGTTRRCLGRGPGCANDNACQISASSKDSSRKTNKDVGTSVGRHVHTTTEG